MDIKNLVLLGGARTPMAEFNGAFAGLSALELGALAAREALERSGYEPAEIDHTVVGNALQTSPTPSTAPATWRSRPACRTEVRR